MYMEMTNISPPLLYFSPPLSYLSGVVTYLTGVVRNMSNGSVRIRTPFRHPVIFVTRPLESLHSPVEWPSFRFLRSRQRVSDCVRVQAKVVRDEVSEQVIFFDDETGESQSLDRMADLPLL